MAPFYGCVSTASLLQSQYEKKVYFSSKQYSWLIARTYQEVTDMPENNNSKQNVFKARCYIITVFYKLIVPNCLELTQLF